MAFHRQKWSKQHGMTTELAPTEEQITIFIKHTDAARFVWNWALGRKIDVMDLNKLPIPHIKNSSAMDLHKELVRLKKTKFQWLSEVSKCAPQEALRNLDRAFKNLYESHFGFPKFKSKKWAKKSFRITGDKITVADNAIRFPIIGWVKLKECGYLLSEGAVHILSATVSERAGRWFVSLTVAEDLEVPKNHGPVVGIDRGIIPGNLLVVGTADGTPLHIIPSPRASRNSERKLNRLQMAVSQKKDGSKNRAKAAQRLARQHLKIANIRKDALNKATTALAKVNSVIVIEDLAVRAMMGNHRLAKLFADAALSEAVRQLEYKCRWYGSKLVYADRFYPSTKRCSKCGVVKNEYDDALNNARIFRCEICGFEVDRDINAAANLAQWPSVRWTLEVPASESQNSAGKYDANADLTCLRLST